MQQLSIGATSLAAPLPLLLTILLAATGAHPRSSHTSE